MKNKKLMLFTVLFLAGSLVFAHKPVIDEDQKKIVDVENPEVSQVVYHEVNNSGTELVLRLEGKKGQRLFISIGVPKIERLRNYRPQMAFLGEGFPNLEKGFQKAPTDQGIVFSAQGTPREFHEPFTDTHSWILIEQYVTLPADGTYYLVGYTNGRGEKNQKFWLTVGEREEFGLGDLIEFPRWTEFVRKFHEVD